MTQTMTHRERILNHIRPESEIVFSIEEYAQRLTRVRAGMAAAGIDTLYLTSPEAICYLSGYRAEWYQAQGPKSWLPVSGLAVHADADDYIHFEVQNEQVIAGFTSVSRDLRIFGGDAQPGNDLLEFIVDELDGEGWLSGTVGMEMFSYRPKRGVSEMLQAAMEAKGATVVDGTEIVGKVRKIKSPQELAYTRTAARIGDVGMAAALDTIRAGVTELDVYGEIVRAMARAGGENSSITMPVSSGAKSACMHALASRRKIMPGDVVNVDLCGVFNRYHANMARTICVGEPHPEVSRYLDAVTGVKAMLADVIRPNLPVRELLDTIEAYYRDAGIWQDQCWVGGYDLGISFPPDWVGPWFYDVHTDSGDEVFEPGMATNYEANFYLPDLAGMSMFIDMMSFTEDTAEFLQETPARLPVVE
ncbi:MAG: Xaa-Pro peptidase family protein [Alphaproteobacteria bacterium]|mgnify:FL=1|jgi:Xaa-Pro dipeptidase|nr:aminopeptidase P family protein [Rhodospirillaceae bacterium]MDG2482290.1 Xaa-Pro peptidase family protein [Alphaproteobacteria bacterium]